MGFHCNKYPFTIKHRVFFKTFCENILKIHLLEFYQAHMTAAMAFYEMPYGMILVAWSSSGIMDIGFTTLRRH